MYQIKRRLLGAIALSVFLGMTGCGSDGKDGKDADPAALNDLQSQIDQLSTTDALKDVRPEACVLCHDDSGSLAKSGAQHQVEYEEFYQDQVLRVINLAYSNDGTNDIVTFDMFKKDELGVYQPFDCRLATSNPEPDVTDALSINWVQYDSTNRRFSDGAASTFWKPIKGILTYDGNGGCTSTNPESATLGDLSLRNGHIAVYGRDETLEANPDKHIASPKFPFAAMIKTGTPGTDYVSVANASGCENCHTRPFLKHTYIYGEVSENVTDLANPGNDGNDFYVCKTCHLDARNGGHEDWQILADDPARHAEIVAGDDLTAEEEAKYAYKTRLMNDVHMSHAMEFGFPQSMRNCVTCHGDYKGDDPTKDKLAETIHADNFLPETCISCHSIDGIVAKMKGTAASPITVHNQFADPDGNGIVTASEADTLRSKKCYACHSPAVYTGPDGTDYGPTGTGTAGAGPEFIDIHTGYDPEIYTDSGVKYSEAITVSIDNASFDKATNVLTIEFSASENIAINPYDPEDIVPTVMVGPYGYDAKQYIVYPHGSDANGKRLLEYDMGGSSNPRFTEVDTGDPTTWEVDVDMSMWADMIADGTIRRLEIGVMPQLAHESITELDRRGNLVPMLVAMNAPSRTFDITVPSSGAFLNEYPDVADGVEDDVVDVLNGCNSCHDALATTFHSAQRGGNIKICKMCHVASAAGSHLEMQSRSIDSYVHAIHSFQLFDIGDIDISDPVEAAEHAHHLSAEFPRFGIKNCESCHKHGKYGVPSQAHSLPSLHAGSDDTQFERNIGNVPRYVMGPAARACGACHRAQMLRADDADKLAAFNDHVRTFGYLVEDGDGVWEAVVEKIMTIFE